MRSSSKAIASLEGTSLVSGPIVAPLCPYQNWPQPLPNSRCPTQEQLRIVIGTMLHASFRRSESKITGTVRQRCMLRTTGYLQFRVQMTSPALILCPISSERRASNLDDLILVCPLSARYDIINSPRMRRVSYREQGFVNRVRLYFRCKVRGRCMSKVGSFDESGRNLRYEKGEADVESAASGMDDSFVRDGATALWQPARPQYLGSRPIDRSARRSNSLAGLMPGVDQFPTGPELHVRLGISRARQPASGSF